MPPVKPASAPKAKKAPAKVTKPVVTETEAKAAVLADSVGPDPEHSRRSKRANANGRALEVLVAKMLCDAGFNADRVVRNDDYGASDVDVTIDELPHVRVDSKYRQAMEVHTLFEVAKGKYCKDPADVMLLPTKSAGSKTVYVTMEAADVFEMLAIVALQRGDGSAVRQQGLLACPLCSGTAEAVNVTMGLIAFACSCCHREFLLPQSDVPADVVLPTSWTTKVTTMNTKASVA